MALKGKKKSRSRGSQARRRPAAAPRPTYGGREKPRWYQTTQGIVIGFLVIATAIVFVWWFVADNRNESQELESRQTALQDYTDDIRVLIENVTPLTTELATAGELTDDELSDKTKDWNEQLSDIQTTLSQSAPPEEATALTSIISQSLLLYGQAIEHYDLLPDLEGKPRDSVSAQGDAALAAANNLFSSAIQLLDQARESAELTPSGLAPPTTDSIPVTPQPTEGGGG